MWNFVRAQQLCQLHIQEISFHDLDVPRVREGDAQLLSQHGIEFDCKQISSALGKHLCESTTAGSYFHYSRLMNVAQRIYDAARGACIHEEVLSEFRLAR